MRGFRTPIRFCTRNDSETDFWGIPQGWKKSHGIGTEDYALVNDSTVMQLEIRGEDRSLITRYWCLDECAHLVFEPFGVEYDGLTLEISPLVWNGVQFRVQPPLTSDDLLQSWAFRWIDLEESAEADSDGLGTYVHSVTEPENELGAMSLSVDFGSAPVDSLLELLTLLRDSGATNVEIHSRAVLG